MVLVLAYVIVGFVRESNWWCERQDIRQHEQLEKAVSVPLRGLTYRVEPLHLDQYSTCLAAGMPSKIIIASVEEWQSVRVADLHFQSMGWSFDNGSLRSADGRYRVSNLRGSSAEHNVRVFLSIASPHRQG
jgi:hypothetical protein